MDSDEYLFVGQLLPVLLLYANEDGVWQLGIEPTSATRIIAHDEVMI